MNTEPAATWPTECEEVADNMPTAGILSWKDAVAYVTRTMGAPDEVGYQIHDNVAEALWIRAGRP